ncbi:AraC family transcriptional regulator ligand-binding domain-containing protein [Acinetobacter gyllenbergii]|uniref:AraC family transcriptional regulator n=1 Tax=Acinetobacter gyllenbergii TaxID=134534 RepID=UPI003F543040
MQNLLVSFCSRNNILISNKIVKLKIDELIPLQEWISLLDEINHQYSKSGLGLEISKHVDPRNFGILGYLLLSCNTVLDALMQFEKYQRLNLETKETTLFFKDNSVVISWEKDIYIKNNSLIDELLMAIFVKIFNQLVYPNSIVIDKIFLNSEKKRPSYIYENFFGCPVEFLDEGASIHISMDSAFLEISSSDPLLNSILTKQADFRLAKFSNTDNFDDLLSNGILKAIKYNTVNVDYVANTIGLSTHTFQLKMKAKGYSFKEKLSLLRRDLAIDFLLNENLSILEISKLLGYREQTSFIRSFKGWTGISPLQYRKRNLKRSS